MGARCQLLVTSAAGPIKTSVSIHIDKDGAPPPHGGDEHDGKDQRTQQDTYTDIIPSEHKALPPAESQTGNEVS